MRFCWIFFIFLISIAVYSNIHHFDFIHFDDDTYVTKNSIVNKGLSAQNIRNAFGLSQNGTYWHPLTWISHMLDCQLFGLDPGMHHLTSLIFHILNASLLFIVFYAMTGAILRSAFLAALFAVHPINVDSVAWIAERKNVLSTFFWMLTMLSYLYYARKPGTRRYFLLLVPFILGLLAKPMLVTLPCVLLLMDFWPLGRLRIFSSHVVNVNPYPKYQPAALLPLIMEKIPLLVLSFFSIGMSMLSLRHGNQTVSRHIVPMVLRLENMAVSYVKYIFKLLWPKDLAVFYPFPDMIPIWQVFGAILVLLAVTVSASLLVRKAPFFIIGWFWFLGTLFPVSGLVQGGRWPEMADRWAYVPAIGIFIIISWGGAALLSKLPGLWLSRPFLAAAAILALIFTARGQAAYWENEHLLWRHAIDITKNNDVAHFNLGTLLSDVNRKSEAIIHFREAIKISPDQPDIHINLGNALAQIGKTEDAIPHFKKALALDPENALAYYNLGNAYAGTGKFKDAISCFSDVLRIDTENVEAHNNLGMLLAMQGDLEGGIRHLKTAVTLNPRHFQGYINLGDLLGYKSDTEKAIQYYQHALAISPESETAREKLENLIKRNNLENEIKKQLVEDPDNLKLLLQLGSLYQQTGRIDEAIEQYQRIIAINPESKIAYFNMAVAHLANKNHDLAIEVFKEALRVSPNDPNIYYNIACIYSREGMIDEAVIWLGNAIEHEYTNWQKIKNDPDLFNLRSTPYYQSLIEKIK